MATLFMLIGDLVDSRRVPSRRRAQSALTTALEHASKVVPPVDRLEATVGDEFQGVYVSFAEASTAALLVRLRLSVDGQGMDVRCGLGAGEREVLRDDSVPMLQDGSGWWSARAAIDVLGTPAGRQRRTWLDTSHAPTSAPPADLANAYLLTRDALVDRLGTRAHAMLLHSLGGSNQRGIAETLGVSTSAVSQAFGRGVGAVRDAQAMLNAMGTR